MISWKEEKNAVLNNWPKIVYSNLYKNKPFIDILEEKAWSINNENDWRLWLKKIDHIWPENNFIEDINEKSADSQYSDNIIYDLGITLGKSIRYLLNLKNQSLLDKNNKHIILEKFFHHKNIKFNQNISISEDNIILAKEISEEFHIKEIIIGNQTDNDWLKKQLLNIKTGFSQLSSIFAISKQNIGSGKLSLWLYQHSIYQDSFITETGQLEVHKNGGDIAKMWFLWKLSYNSLTNTSFNQTIKAWNDVINNKHYRKTVEYQKQFLHKTEISLQNIMRKYDFSEELSQKTFRRYRAYKKWKNDIILKNTHHQLLQKWQKLKIGNKIAWSTSKDENMQFIKHIEQQWIWEENLIEAAFFKIPHWNVPSWIQRYIAIEQNCWKKDITEFTEETLFSIWALGFESIILNNISYNSWLAQNNICHPYDIEYHDFLWFFKHYLLENI